MLELNYPLHSSLGKITAIVVGNKVEWILATGQDRRSDAAPKHSFLLETLKTCRRGGW